MMAILCFSAVFSIEYKCSAVWLVAAKPLGRGHTVRCKIAVGLLFMLRAFACVLLILAVLAVSLRACSAVYAMLILTAALAAPAVLSLMGIGWAYSVSVLSILTGSPILLASRGIPTAVLGFALPTLIGAGCAASLLRKNAMRAA